MNKKQYKELVGEDPEDMFGTDWENAIEVHKELHATSREGMIEAGGSDE